MTAKKNPNIVVIFADDLGYGDFGCFGAEKIPTPNVDSLADQGVCFTDAHASSAVCTPSALTMRIHQSVIGSAALLDLFAEHGTFLCVALVRTVPPLNGFGASFARLFGLTFIVVMIQLTLLNRKVHYGE